AVEGGDAGARLVGGDRARLRGAPAIEDSAVGGAGAARIALADESVAEIEVRARVGDRRIEGEAGGSAALEAREGGVDVAGEEVDPAGGRVGHREVAAGRERREARERGEGGARGVGVGGDGG